MSDYIRRLPVYLLLDCSGSMSGEPIEAVKQGIKALLTELKGDPQALETACLSVITFNSTARQISPLTELMPLQGAGAHRRRRNCARRSAPRSGGLHPYRGAHLHRDPEGRLEAAGVPADRRRSHR